MKQKKDWLGSLLRIKALAQIGLNFRNSDYDQERYEEIRGIADGLIADLTNWPVEKVGWLHKGEVSYITPKVDVRVVILQSEQLLLIREKADGLWALPGGWADIGYSPTQVAKKEAKEETGLDIEVGRLLAVFHNHDPAHRHPPSRFHVYKLFFASQVTGGNISDHGHEVLDIGYFDVDRLPPLSEERNTLSQITKLVDAARSTAHLHCMVD